MTHSKINEPSNNIQNTHSNPSIFYLLGALKFILFINVFNLINDVSVPIGLVVEGDPYIAAWTGGIVGLILSCAGCYITSKRITKLQLSDKYNSVKHIIILSLVIIAVFILKTWLIYATNPYYAQSIQGKFGVVYLMTYIDFRLLFTPILSGIVAIALLITLGVKK